MDGHHEQTAPDPEGIPTGVVTTHRLSQQADEGIVSRALPKYRSPVMVLPDDDGIGLSSLALLHLHTSIRSILRKILTIVIDHHSYNN